MNVNNNYFSLILKSVPTAEQELVSDLCFTYGALGVSERLLFQQNQRDYSVETLSQPQNDMEAYFGSAPEAELLTSLRAQWPELEFVVSENENKDWLEEWKKGFEPFLLVDDIWVVPSWHKPPESAKQVILMDPGMAFGTGTHETTRVAAMLLAQELKNRPAARVLDVGTGTGLLALVAEKLGAKRILANDVDAEAIRVAGENLQLNNSSLVEVTTQDLADITEPFDVVVANIIDGVLISLQHHLRRTVAPGGALVLSGVIEERRSSFLQGFVAEPLVQKTEQRLGDWYGYVYSHFS